MVPNVMSVMAVNMFGMGAYFVNCELTGQLVIVADYERFEVFVVGCARHMYAVDMYAFFHDVSDYILIYLFLALLFPEYVP